MATANLMHLNALRVFTVAATHLNFVQAARDLNVSPSAVSHQIRSLEEFLGTKLFLRESRQLALTREGSHLYQRLIDSFRNIGAAVEQVRQQNSSQQVNLICRPFFSSSWLASKLQSLWAAHPKISLNLIHQNTLSSSDFERADLAIIWGKQPPAGVSFIPLMAGGLTPIMHVSLASRAGVPKSPEDLRHFTLLHEENRLSWNEWFELAGTDPVDGKQNYFIDDTNVRYQSMVSGQGIMLGASRLLRSQIESGELIQPFEAVLPDYRYWLVWPQGKLLSVRCKQLIEWLQQEADNMSSYSHRITAVGIPA